jgi:hypothetical protein
VDAQVALLRGLYRVPDAADLAKELPAVGSSIAEAMDLLAREPTLATANQVLAQLNGGLALVQRVRASLAGLTP